MEPFDAYLKYLLVLTVQLKKCDLDQIQFGEHALNFDYSGSKNSRWTLWVSKQVRELFDDRKNELCPEKTHGNFVELLFCIRNYLESKNQLLKFVFFKTCPDDFFNNSTICTTIDQSRLVQNGHSIVREAKEPLLSSIIQNSDIGNDNSYNFAQEYLQLPAEFQEQGVENSEVLGYPNIILDDFFHTLAIEQKPFKSHEFQSLNFANNTLLIPLLNSRSASLPDNYSQGALLTYSNDSFFSSQHSLGSDFNFTYNNNTKMNSPAMFGRNFFDTFPRKTQSDTSLIAKAKYNSEYARSRVPNRLSEVTKKRSEFKRRKYSYSKISESQLTLRPELTQNLSLDIIKATSLGESWLDEVLFES